MLQDARLVERVDEDEEAGDERQHAPRDVPEHGPGRLARELQNERGHNDTGDKGRQPKLPAEAGGDEQHHRSGDDTAGDEAASETQRRGMVSVLDLPLQML